MDAESTSTNDFNDLIDSILTGIIDLHSASRTKSAVNRSEDDRVKNGAVAWIERTIDEDVCLVTVVRGHWLLIPKDRSLFALPPHSFLPKSADDLNRVTLRETWFADLFEHFAFLGHLPPPSSGLGIIRLSACRSQNQPPGES
ncbi:MAG: hypothetical protein WBC44_16340, partial [Planctomycetaceae bacterium]